MLTESFPPKKVLPDEIEVLHKMLQSGMVLLLVRQVLQADTFKVFMFYNGCTRNSSFILYYNKVK